MGSALKQIRELLKKIKQEDQVKTKSSETREEDEHLAEEPLIISKTKKLVLENVNIKPSVTGKKTVGSLEVH